MHMMPIGKEIILTLPKIAVSSEISNSHHCDPWALLSVPFLRSANRDTLRRFPSSVGTFFREPQKASSCPPSPLLSSNDRFVPSPPFLPSSPPLLFQANSDKLMIFAFLPSFSSVTPREIDNWACSRCLLNKVMFGGRGHESFTTVA